MSENYEETQKFQAFLNSKFPFASELTSEEIDQVYKAYREYNNKVNVWSNTMQAAINSAFSNRLVDYNNDIDKAAEFMSQASYNLGAVVSQINANHGITLNSEEDQHTL